jgi:hypothetical protein
MSRTVKANKNDVPAGDTNPYAKRLRERAAAREEATKRAKASGVGSKPQGAVQSIGSGKRGWSGRGH